MKKTALLFMLLCLLTACLLVGCKSGPTPDETDSTLDTTDTVSGDTTPGSDSETEAETEPETRPEIILPSDPSEIVALIDSIPNGAIENEAQMVDHPAIWGYDLTDEPGSNNFWWIGEAMDVYNEQYFTAQLFANNHPAYGIAGPLGIYAYDKLCATTCSAVCCGMRI